MPKRWFSVGSLGIRKTRANLYFSGQVRYVSMSDALSSRPSPRRGRKASSDGSPRRAIARGAAAHVALGAEHQLVERARLEHLALLAPSSPARAPR